MVDSTFRQINAPQNGTSFSELLVTGAQAKADFQYPLAPSLLKPGQLGNIGFQITASPRLRFIPGPISAL